MKWHVVDKRGRVAWWLCLLLLFSGFLLPLEANAETAPLYSSQELASAQPEPAQEGESLPASSGLEEPLTVEAPKTFIIPDANIAAPEFEPAAPGVCVVSEDANMVVYQKNGEAQYVAASLVKMMTCILTIQNIPDLDGTVIVSDKSWIYDQLYNQNASHADIRMGESLTVRELLYAALLPSGNEAALLLADHISGGDINAFLGMMNATAQSLGCTGTIYVDPNGLSEGNLTTALDMSLIVHEFMNYPDLVEIASTPQYLMAAHEQHGQPYNLFTTNRLIVPSSPYYNKIGTGAVTGTVQGGKTGSLGVWQNFASWATKDDSTYIVVVLNSPNEADALGVAMDPPQARPALYEAALLYDWAFSSLSIRSVLDTTQPISELPVRYSTQQDSIKLLPAEDLRTVLPVDAKDDEMVKVFNLPEFVASPIKQGDVIGTVTLSLPSGYVIGTTNLLAAQDVKRNTTLFIIKKAGEFLGSFEFKMIVIAILVLGAGYIGIAVLLNYLRQQNGTKGGKRR